MKKIYYFVALILISIIATKSPIGKLNVMATESDYSIPVRPIAYESVTIASDARREFVDEMTNFSDKHQFAIRIGSADPDEIDLIIQMWREDFKVIVNNPLGRYTFNVGIYPTCSDNVDTDQAKALMSEILERLSTINMAK